MTEKNLHNILMFYSDSKAGEAEDYAARHPFEYRGAVSPLQFKSARKSLGKFSRKSARRRAVLAGAAAAVFSAAAWVSLITLRRYEAPVQPNLVSLRTPLGVKTVVLKSGPPASRQRAMRNFTTDFQVKTF